MTPYEQKGGHVMLLVRVFFMHLTTAGFTALALGGSIFLLSNSRVMDTRMRECYQSLH